jgi:hypothetical protein
MFSCLWISKKTVLANFQVLFWHSPVETEEQPQDRQDTRRGSNRIPPQHKYSTLLQPTGF